MNAAADRLPFPDAARRHLEDEALPVFLMDQRWYGAKHAGRPQVRIEDAAPLATRQGPRWLCRLRVAPPVGPVRRHLVALAPDIAPGPRDAFADDAVLAALMKRLEAAGASQEGASADGLIFASTRRLPPGLAEGPFQAMPGEQSNTSIRVKGSSVLKIFRRIEPGPHPELEMAARLAALPPDGAGFAHVPPFFGWIGWRGRGEADSTLAVLQGLVPDAVDAWTLITRRLRGQPRGDGDGQPLLALVDLLGRRTAELHRALAAGDAPEAFRPEPTRASDLHAWGQAVRVEAERTFEVLTRARPGLDLALEREVATALGRWDAVGPLIDALIPAKGGFARLRTHGDLHLGQVLVAGGDVVFIDFEGEPMRPLAERRAKHCPLRDVAGMLRSLAYATRVVAREEDPAGDGAAWLSRWRAEATGTFLAAYHAAAQDQPAFPPPDPDDAARLQKLFVLEKIFYEIRYELANRPDWLGIPLADLPDPLRTAPNRVEPNHGEPNQATPGRLGADPRDMA